jgi:hypothetical protein
MPYEEKERGLLPSRECGAGGPLARSLIGDRATVEANSS